MTENLNIINLNIAGQNPDRFYRDSRQDHAVNFYFTENGMVRYYNSYTSEQSEEMIYLYSFQVFLLSG